MELYFNLNEASHNNFQDLKIKVEQKTGKDFDRAIAEEFLGTSIVIGMRISSPLREDNNPSCKWYYWHNHLRLKDFTSGDNLSAIDVVLKKRGWDFKTFAEKVKATWGINPWERTVTTRTVEFAQRKPKRNANIQVSITEQKNAGRSKARVKIYFKKDAWSMDDEVFWRNFNSPLSREKFPVFAAKEILIKGRRKYAFTPESRCYVYPTGEQGECKLYFPYRDPKGKRPRFMSSSGYADIIEGYAQLPPKGKFLVITKSRKDVQAFYDLKVPAIAPQGESQYHLLCEVIPDLQQRFDFVAVMYDFDRTGVKWSNYLRRKFDLPVFFLTDGRFGTRDYRAKDISDYIRLHGGYGAGTKKAMRLVETAKESLIGQLI